MLPDFGQRQLNQLNKTLQILSEPLTKQQLSFRQGPRGQRIPYLETSLAIQQANTAFGPGGWSSEIRNLHQNYLIQDKDVCKVSYTATVRVILENGCFHEDVGQGNADRKTTSEAIEHAQKGAVSDAVKRCLRYFGDGLGNRIQKDNSRNLNVVYTQQKHQTVLKEVIDCVQMLIQSQGKNKNNDTKLSVDNNSQTTSDGCISHIFEKIQIKEEDNKVDKLTIQKPKIVISKKSASPQPDKLTDQVKGSSQNKIKLLKRIKSQKISSQ